MADKDPNSPATTSEFYDDMRESWHKIDAVLGGTSSMRNAGEAYLPQHTEESNAAWRERLDRSVLVNKTELTLNSLVGRPFSDSIVLEDAPSELETILENVDMQGNDINVFSREWFSEGLSKAFSHVLVDFPRTDDVDGMRTMLDDIEEGVRPYWVRIAPEDLFFAHAEIVAGKEVIREIRFWEDYTERVGMAEYCKRQIRRMYIENGTGIVEIWKKNDDKKIKEDWVKVEDYTFDLDFIPLVTFYSSRKGFMRGKSQIEDLADLNIAHWQSASDQQAILTTARFPIIAVSGGTDENKMVIGPHRYLYSPDPSARFYYVEHTGAAIASGRNDLKDLEEQMAEYGADFLKKRPGGETATARALDSAEATSPLQDNVMRFSDALAQVIHITGLWSNNDFSSVSLEISTDYGPEDANPADLDALKKAREMRDISRKAFLKELMRRGVLSDEYDIEEDAEEVENEAMDMLAGGAPSPTLPTGGGPEEPEDEPEPEDENQPQEVAAIAGG